MPLPPEIQKILQGTPFVGMGSTLEKNALIGVVRGLILQNKWTIKYILDYCESAGYSRQKASDVFMELTGIDTKFAINNNDYFKNPVYVPAGTIAWGMSKGGGEEAYYIVPWYYGYTVMFKNETESPVPQGDFSSINEAVAVLKTHAKDIQTQSKIVTDVLLEDNSLESTARNLKNINYSFVNDPIFELKEKFKNKQIGVEDFDKVLLKMASMKEITAEQINELYRWKLKASESMSDSTFLNEDFDKEKKDLDFEKGYKEGYEAGKFGYETGHPIDFSDPNSLDDYKSGGKSEKFLDGFRQGYDDGFNNEQDEFGDLEASEPLDFEKVYEEFLYNTDEQERPNKDELKAKFEQFKHKLFTNVDNKLAADRLYQLYLGFSPAEITGNVDFLDKKEAADNNKLGEIMDEAEGKDSLNDEVIKLESLTLDELMEDSTPEQFFENSLEDQKSQKISAKVDKCIDEFSKKFNDINGYDIKITDYKVKILDALAPINKGLISDPELESQATLSIIFKVNAKEDTSVIKKCLTVFAIDDNKTHWTGTFTGEDDRKYSFGEDGLNSLFETEDAKDEIIEDII